MKVTYITVKRDRNTSRDYTSISINSAYKTFRETLVRMGYPQFCHIIGDANSEYFKVGYVYGMPKNKPALMVKFIA